MLYNVNINDQTEENFENVELTSIHVRTRFHVNRVDNNEDQISLSGDQETKKSLGNMTSEALPRLDNYRDVTSIQAARRPTLDELHYSTLNSKTLGVNAVPLNHNGSTKSEIKFGWIQGVLMRCLLNIWGVMLFLRLSWVVAQTGIGQAILLILTTTVVTTITSLSMSAISTNGLIKGGGTYYMISRSLGPEFGGSIGLIFSLANAVACSMYIVGFCESLMDIIQPAQYCIIDCAEWDIRIIGCITVTILLVIVMIGMEWETKAQLGLLIILLVALGNFIIGTFVGPQNDNDYAKGFIGYSGEVFKRNLSPDYREYDGVQYNFFSVLAIFFPAATGILAGANISGDLKDPQQAIPKGTLWAILLTTISYLTMAVMVGATVMRDASGNIADIRLDILLDTTISSFNTSIVKNLTDESLRAIKNFEPFYGIKLNCTGPCEYGIHNSFQVIELVSAYGPLIYAGCFAATLSSALASLVSAPKVFQALCQDHLYPGIAWFNGESNREPIRGYLLTFIIAIGFILIGNLNSIAPLISNFFLAAYMLINFSTFHASLAKPIGWRPTFKYYNMWLSFIGAIICVSVMFLISWWTAVITLSIVLSLYFVVSHQKPDVNWGSTTQAQTYNNALTTIQQLDRIEEHVKNYKPQVLVLSGTPASRPALIELAYDITKNESLLICGNIIESALTQKTRTAMLIKSSSWLKSNKIKGFYTIVDSASFQDGATSLLQTVGLGKLRPNILLMGYKQDWSICSQDDLNMYFNVMHKALDMHVAIVLLRLSESSNVLIDDNDDSRKGELIKIHGNQSFSPLSRASSTSDVSVPGTPQVDRSKISRNDTLQYNHDKKLNFIKLPRNVMNSITKFKRKQKNGTIDVWWLYDDGGLTLLLPYIINTRRNWSNTKLRVFTLANKNSELVHEQRNMASLLSKFRIDYSTLRIIPDISSAAQTHTRNFFDRLIANFSNSNTSSHHSNNNQLIINKSELMAMNDKTNRHLRLRELLIENSMDANLIVMTLPMPRKGAVSAPLYMAWLETLTRDMPPFLLVRGNHTSVLTFYS